MKFLVYQIISVVTANEYGCNDISKRTKQSQCYIQHGLIQQGLINSDNMKQAVQCCLSNRAGAHRIFDVPLVQFRELSVPEKNHHYKRRGLIFTDQSYSLEKPICYPSSEDELTNFYNFLNEFGQRKFDSRHETIDKRWDCFLTADHSTINGENNFCKRVLKEYKQRGVLESIRKDICEENSILPSAERHIRGKAYILNNIKSMNKRKSEGQRMVYLNKNKRETEDFEEHWSNYIRVFESKEVWNDYETPIRKVKFKEDYNRNGRIVKNIPVVQELKCGCSNVNDPRSKPAFH